MFSVILYYINKLGPTCVHTCRCKESSATHHNLFFLIPETLPRNYTILAAAAPLQSRLIIWVEDIITKNPRWRINIILPPSCWGRNQEGSSAIADLFYQSRVCETKVSFDCFSIKYIRKKLLSVTPTCWIEDPWLSDASVT